METTEIQEIIYGMLTECTGAALCDSGGAYGRNWERNSKKSIADFINEPDVTCDDLDVTESTDLCCIISVFHYLSNQLELNEVCRAFNSIPVDDWDGDLFYGLSLKGQKFLESLGVTELNAFNTYNGESDLSQVLQGAYFQVNDIDYVILQIHNGCDVRGGYTDAKIFVLNEWNDGYLKREAIYGDIDGVQIDNQYNGYSLTTENGESVPVTKKSKVSIYLID